MARGVADAAVLYPNLHAEKQKQLARTSSAALAAKREKHGTVPVSALPVAKASSRAGGRAGLRPVTACTSPTPRSAAGACDRAPGKPSRTLAPVANRRGSLLVGGSDANSANQREDAAESSIDDASQRLDERKAFTDSAPEEPTRVRAARDVTIRGDLGLPAASVRPPLLSLHVSVGWASVPRPRTGAGLSPSLADATSLPDVALSARPRSRFARRDSSRWSGGSQSLERISTAPVLQSFHPSDADGGEINRRGAGGAVLGASRSTVELSSVHQRSPTRSAATAVALASTSATLTTWGERDVANFFLTEVDKVPVDADVDAARRRQETKQRLARAIASASYLLYGLQQLEPAVAKLADAIAVAETLRPPAGGAYFDALVGLLHHHAGVALKELGRAKLALAAQQRSLETALRVRDRKLQARAVKALGVLLLDVHDVRAALEHQQEALAIAIEDRDRELEARACANLGNLAAAEARFGHALACHERDLALSQSPALSSAGGAARAHRNLSVVYGRLHKRALQLKHEALARELEDGARAFEADVERHAADSVANWACQLSARDDELAEMVAAALRSAAEARRRRRELDRRHGSAVAAAAAAAAAGTGGDTGEQRRGAAAEPLCPADVSGGCGERSTILDTTEAKPKRPSVTLRINNYPVQ